MISVLDICSGKWEDGAGDDLELERLCCGRMRWNATAGRAQSSPQPAIRLVDPGMPADLVERDLDDFLARMEHPWG